MSELKISMKLDLSHMERKYIKHILEFQYGMTEADINRISKVLEVDGRFDSHKYNLLFIRKDREITIFEKVEI